MKEIYFISGLGADERVFDFLSLDNSINKHFIKWLKPEAQETIEEYAKRLSQQIDLSKEFVLIGVSFGGIIAIEIAKLTMPSKVIIISSARDKNAISYFFKFTGILKLHKVIPDSFLKSSDHISQYFFGTESKEEKNLLKKILKDTDIHFLRWALGQVFKWKNQQKIESLIQIHGTHDKILKFQQADYIIVNGGHFMIVNKSAEISKIINAIITSRNNSIT